MKQINILYSTPVLGCLIHTYEDINEALSDAKKTCKELGCTAVIMTVEYSVDKLGEAK